MHYYISIAALDGSVYSCDKICIMGKINYSCVDFFNDELVDFFWSNRLECVESDLSLPFGYKGLKKYVYYEKFGIKFYRNNFEILLTDETSFYFAYKHNSQLGNEHDISWKIELNPNKCLPCEFVSSFVSFVISRSKPSTVRISQMDIAIDFRTERLNVFLDKDRRTHTRIDSGSDNITEYLSKHNENGFVKLYNKTSESDLDYSLTRLEITLKDLSFSNFKNVFPRVHVYDYSQMTFDDDFIYSLSQNDQVFICLLRLHPEYFQKLTFRKQQKFRQFLLADASLLKPDVNAFVNLVECIRNDFGVSK